MKESDPQVRFACIEALGRGTTVEDLTSLRLAFFASEKSVKLAAVKVLGASKLPQAMEIISLSFGEDDEAVLAAALDALIAIPVTPEWVAKKKRYLRDFTQMPNAPKDLKDKAAKAKP
jgi:HEAT repeat protein